MREFDLEVYLYKKNIWTKNSIFQMNFNILV